MSGVPWAKIWWTWYTSRSHLGLSGVALAIGPALMLLGRESMARHDERHSDASSDGECAHTSDAVVIADASGRPVTAEMLAAVTRFDVASVSAGLGELVACGTLSVSPCGAYAFPRFRRYQEAPSAARMRKLRASPARHGKRHSDAHSDGACDSKRKEERGKRVERGASAPESPAAPPASVVRELFPERGQEAAQKPAGGAKKPRSTKAPASEAKAALKAAVRELCDGYGHTVPPTAGEGPWSDGAAKVASWAERRGVSLAEAAEVVARSALERLRSGGSSTWGYALRDCTPGVAVAVRGGAQGIRPPATTAELGPPTDLDAIFGPEAM